VRKLPAAFAISAALHVGALLWVSVRHHVLVSLPPGSPAPPPPGASPADEPVAIVLLDRHTSDAIATVPSAPAPPVSHGAGHAPGKARITTGRGPHPGETGPSHPTGSGHSPLMAMRGPELGREGLSGDFVGSFLDSSRPLEHGPEATGELRPSGGGTYESHHTTFSAHVNRDGTVKLDDTPDFSGPHLGKGGMEGRMGIDDWFMRRHGIDPYSSEKLKWLDRTRDERVAIGKEFRKEQLAHSAQYMQRNLQWVWQSTTDPVRRKQAVFQLWDDVAETGEPELVEGGAAARAYLVGFIRTHLPKGSPNGFTDEELAKLNARKQSSATFAPYE
jgi:hypothetical protein